MQGHYIPPSLGSKAFNCAYCGAFSHQSWFAIRAVSVNKIKLIQQSDVEDAKFSDAIKEEVRKEMVGELTRILNNEIRIRPTTEPSTRYSVENIHISKCFSCAGVSLWKREALLFPRIAKEFQPNPDLKDDIQHDFLEAAEVLDISPRAAGALLRLCLQKLCLQLGLSGDINSDIGDLVKLGLDPRMQKSLDLVRVVGNEAVHPGVMDLRDDRATVAALFHIINRIAQDLITHPKEVDALYSSLPGTKLDQIAKRDSKSS